jgi:hypothetical protein
MYPIGSYVGKWITRAFFNNLMNIGLERTLREYSLEQASLIAYRLVKEVIKIDGLPGEPIDVWTVVNDEVKQKSEAELKRLKTLYDKWIDEERLVTDSVLSCLD